MNAQTAYEYRAGVVRWIDGDTVELEVDLGFHLTRQDHFRLDGIDTPEKGKAGAITARLRAEQLAPPGTEVQITTTKADKYGRYLAAIWTDVGPTINHILVEEGFAKPYFGGKKDVAVATATVGPNGAVTTELEYA
jgi:micrococcal nuclease